MIAVIIISVLFIVFSGFVIAGYIFAKKTTHPKSYPDDFVVKYINTHQGFDVEKFLSSLPEPELFDYKSEFGYVLKGRIYKNNHSFPDGKQRVCIFCHGFTANWLSMVVHGNIYWSLGFSLVFYDHRSHGESGGPFCSMGYFESKDLVGLTHFVRKSFSKDALIGLQGVSMGSATALMACSELSDLAFCCDDCGFADMRGELEAVAHMFKSPAYPLISIAAFFIKKKYGFSIDDVKPVEKITKVEFPVLFIHGNADILVPVQSAECLFKAKERGVKEIKIFDKSAHAMCISDYPEDYNNLIRSFLEKNKIIV